MAQVLFGWKPGWRDAIAAAMRRGGHDMTMAPLDGVDPSAFDAVVPLELSDQNLLDTHRAAGRRVRGLWPPRKVRRTCNDKLLCNRTLIAAGLGALVPALHDHIPADPSAYPLVLKARTGAFGIGTAILPDRNTALSRQNDIAAGTHFLQSWVPGDTEHATHLLLHRGEVRFAATAFYRIGTAPIVRGKDHHGPVTEWITGKTPHLETMLACLRAVGFADGICCIDWRETPQGPRLFEINPRFGASLAHRADEFVAAYVACTE